MVGFLDATFLADAFLPTGLFAVVLAADFLDATGFLDAEVFRLGRVAFEVCLFKEEACFVPDFEDLDTLEFFASVDFVGFFALFAVDEGVFFEALVDELFGGGFIEQEATPLRRKPPIEHSLSLDS